MGAKVIILVLCATVASSRHLVDMNSYLVPFVPTPDAVPSHDSETVLERRNIDYGSKTNLNGPRVQPLYRHDSDINNRRIPERHTHRYHKHEVSESFDSNNNIYAHDDFKLRTNVPSASYTYTTEYTTSDMIAYTNVEPDVNTRTSVSTLDYLPKETFREPDIDQYYRHGDVPNINTRITPKTNKNTVTNINDQPNIDSNNVSSPSNQNNFMNQKEIVNTNEPVNRRHGKPKTNQLGVPKNSRTNETRPFTLDRGKAIDNIPNRKEDDEEIPWVWGTERADKETTTEKNGLDDRAAFTGDQCPTGKTKVEGMCVEKH